MSKITISQLNATELNTLNDRELNEVVGGNSQVAAISSSTGNSVFNAGAALGVNIGQNATSTNAIVQTINDNDVQANVASILAGVGL